MKKYTLDAKTAKIKTIYVEYIPHEKDKGHFSGDPQKVQDKNGNIYVPCDHRLLFWGYNLHFYFDTYKEAADAVHFFAKEIEVDIASSELVIKQAKRRLAEMKRRARKFKRKSDKLRTIHG